VWKLVGPLVSVHRLVLFFPYVYRFPDPSVHPVAFSVDHLGTFPLYDVAEREIAWSVTASLLIRPEVTACRADFSFTGDVLFFFVNAKSPRCVGWSARNFAQWSALGWILLCRSKISEGLPQKNFMGKKHAKFGPISDDFEVWRRISPERMKIFEIGHVLDLSVVAKFSHDKLKNSQLHRIRDHFLRIRDFEGPSGSPASVTRDTYRGPHWIITLVTT